MNSVAYGFRDDITDDELELLLDSHVVFECDRHGVLEITGEGDLDQSIAALRRGDSLPDPEDGTDGTVTVEP